MRHAFVYLLMAISMTSCGFQLRQPVVLAAPLHHPYIKTAAPYNALARNLRDYFKMSGITVASSPEQASIILDILEESESQQLLSVSSNQQSRQYNLIVKVTFQLTDIKGNILVPKQSVSEIRSLPIQSNQILGGSNEAQSVYQQMWLAIVYDIANYLASRDTTRMLTKHASSL